MKREELALEVGEKMGEPSLRQFSLEGSVGFRDGLQFLLCGPSSGPVHWEHA